MPRDTLIYLNIFLDVVQTVLLVWILWKRRQVFKNE